MRAAIIIGAILAMSAAPAVTARQARPEQTIESAVTFLDTLARSGQLKANVSDGNGFGVARDARASHQFPDVQITSVAIYHKDAKCTSVLKTGQLQTIYDKKLGPSEGAYLGNPASGLFSGAATYRHEYGLTSYAEGMGSLSWNTVRTVTQDGSNVIVGVRDGLTARFGLPTPELAARVAYAMEFIRLECDPTANSAF